MPSPLPLQPLLCSITGLSRRHHARLLPYLSHGEGHPATAAAADTATAADTAIAAMLNSSSACHIEWAHGHLSTTDIATAAVLNRRAQPPLPCSTPLLVTQRGAHNHAATVNAARQALISPAEHENPPLPSSTPIGSSPLFPLLL